LDDIEEIFFTGQKVGEQAKAPVFNRCIEDARKTHPEESSINLIPKGIVRERCSSFSQLQSTGIRTVIRPESVPDLFYGRSSASFSAFKRPVLTPTATLAKKTPPAHNLDKPGPVAPSTPGTVKYITVPLCASVPPEGPTKKASRQVFSTRAAVPVEDNDEQKDLVEVPVPSYEVGDDLVSQFVVKDFGNVMRTPDAASDDAFHEVRRKAAKNRLSSLKQGLGVGNKDSVLTTDSSETMNLISTTLSKLGVVESGLLGALAARSMTEVDTDAFGKTLADQSDLPAEDTVYRAKSESSVAKSRSSTSDTMSNSAGDIEPVKSNELSEASDPDVIPDPAVKHLRVLASDLVLPETPRELLTQKASSNTGLQTEEKYIISKLRNTSEEVASDLLGPSSYHLLEHEENRSGNNPVAAGGADLEPVACEQPAKDGFIADFSSPSLAPPEAFEASFEESSQRESHESLQGRSTHTVSKLQSCQVIKPEVVTAESTVELASKPSPAEEPPTQLSTCSTGLLQLDMANKLALQNLSSDQPRLQSVTLALPSSTSFLSLMADDTLSPRSAGYSKRVKRPNPVFGLGSMQTTSYGSSEDFEPMDADELFEFLANDSAPKRSAEKMPELDSSNLTDSGVTEVYMESCGFEVALSDLEDSEAEVEAETVYTDSLLNPVGPGAKDYLKNEEHEISEFGTKNSNFLEPLRFELALSDLEDSEPEFEAELPEDLLDSHAFDTKDQSTASSSKDTSAGFRANSPSDSTPSLITEDSARVQLFEAEVASPQLTQHQYSVTESCSPTASGQATPVKPLTLQVMQQGSLSSLDVLVQESNQRLTFKEM
jgi:hypothetical protein